MRRSFLVFLCLIFATGQSVPLHAQTNALIDKMFGLKDPDYAVERKILLADGWKPVQGACQNGFEKCASFPEIDICSADDQCSMSWSKAGQHLDVTTRDANISAVGVGSPYIPKAQYHLARKVILANGWKPLRGACTQTSKSACASFPEITSCKNIAPSNYCYTIFARRNVCLRIFTTNAQPQDDAADKAIVIDGTLYFGPCATDY